MTDKLTDAEFIHDPFEWPCYPLLPMVLLRKDKDKRSPFCGVMVNDVTPPYRVYHKPLGNFVTGMLDTQLEGVKVESYATVEALLADWRID